MRSAVVAVALALAVTPVRAQLGWDALYVTDNYDGVSDCSINGQGPRLVQVFVFHNWTDGSSGLRFSLPLPDCMNNAVHISEWSDYATVGESPTGIVIDYGGCISSSVRVLTINLLLYTSTEECCFYVAQAHPESSSRKAEVFDCAGVPYEIRAGAAVFNANMNCECDGCEIMTPEVSSPFPEDGGINVSVSAILTWDTFDPEHVPTEHSIKFGTDPNPPKLPGRFTDYSWDPGPLQQGTTYYWSVIVWSGCGAGMVGGPVWTFTTRSDLPVDATTWGRIKSLYASPE